MRHIFISDIHGCFDELRQLLDRIAPAEDDVVVSVGDIVGKGPRVEECLALWHAREYLAVLGNHEEEAHGFDGWPLYLDFPEAHVAVVHGGVMPETSFDNGGIEAQRDTVTTLRFVRRVNGSWQPVPKNRQRDGDRFWSEVWNGDRLVIYGHTPRDDVRRDAKAIGLDTSCVYGGKLTAAIYDGEQWRFESVPAARRYASRPLLGRLRKWLKR